MTDDEDLTPAEKAGKKKRERTRSKLITAASLLVRDDGMEARAEDIAEEAGVSVATFYNVFPTRKSLFSTLFSVECYEPIQDVVRAPSRLADVTYTQQIYFGALSLRIVRNPHVIRGALSTRYMTDPKEAWWADPFDAFVQAIMIVSGVWLEERGYAEEDNPKLRAATSASFIGALDHAVHHPKGFELADVLEVPAPNALKFKVNARI